MKRKVGLLLSLLLLVSCDNHKPTKLIILLVGDQMRPDHLSRFESLYTDVFALIKDGYLYRSTYGTSHGSPYDYDTHVQLLFAREGRKYHHINHHAETVDIVPTILDILNIQTEINLHGKILPIK